MAPTNVPQSTSFESHGGFSKKPATKTRNQRLAEHLRRQLEVRHHDSRAFLRVLSVLTDAELS
jgi:hypothetical protein